LFHSSLVLGEDGLHSTVVQVLGRPLHVGFVQTFVAAYVVFGGLSQVFIVVEVAEKLADESAALPPAKLELPAACQPLCSDSGRSVSLL